MRRLLFVLSFALLMPAIARPDQASELRDRVLKAFAKDPTDIKKMRVHILKAKGTAFFQSAIRPATQEIYAVWPGSMRINWEFIVGDQKVSKIQVASDDKGWRKESDVGITELDIERLNDLRADAYAMWTATLSTLNEEQIKLSMAPASKVGETAVVGLKVSRRSFPDVVLYFDEKTALLRKMEYRNRNEGVVLKMELIFDGHKEIGGLMLPTKQTTIVQGKEVFNWFEMEYGFAEKIDPKTFQKP